MMTSDRWRLGLIQLLVLLSVFHLGCGDDSEERSRAGDGYVEKPPSWRFEFDRFLEREGIPVHEGFSTGPIDQLELAPWKRLGGRGAYVKLHGQQGLVSTYVHELAPGERSKAERHVYDEILYVFSGEGVARFWQPVPNRDGVRDARELPGSAVSFGVQRGSLLAPPLNAFHAIENTGTKPLLIVGFTNAPPVVDLYRNDRFVFENEFVFDERWVGPATGAEDPSKTSMYFESGPRPGPDLPRGNANDPFRVNFVRDVRKLEPVMHSWKGKRADFASFWMSAAALSPHISRWDAESYQTAHRHNGGATILLLDGEGYFMMWPRVAGTEPYRDGLGDLVVREDFGMGSLYSPPDDWYHQHFNAHPQPALYLAVTPQGRERRLGYVLRPDHLPPAISEVEQRVPERPPILIRRKHEDPQIGRDFERAVRESRADAPPD